MSLAPVREEICRLGRSLFDRGYTHGTSGNISVLLDDGQMLVTPTNASLGDLDPSALAVVDPDGRPVGGLAPTKELPLHNALYRTRGAARAIVHLHSTHSVAASMLHDLNPADMFPPMTAYYLMKVGRTALLPYYRPGDPRVADAIDDLQGLYSSIVLANHGPVVAGVTLAEAGAAIEELEQTAKLYLLVGHRQAKFLDEEEAVYLQSR
jgi:ribulose-5-phosphate 4-epimerase/fuculose-1-phosphate aldolase